MPGTRRSSAGSSAADRAWIALAERVSHPSVTACTLSVVTAATAWPSSTRPLRLALATLLGACVLLLSLIELALSTAGSADPL